MGFASRDTRERAVAAYKSGQYTQAQVGAMFGVHFKTLANWMKADAEGREQVPRKKGHMARILTPDDLARIDSIIQANPSTTIAGLMEAIGKFCSPNVYSRALKELGYTFKKNFKGGRAGSGGYQKAKGRMEGVE